MEKQNLKLYEKKQIPTLVAVLGLLLVAVGWIYWIMPMWDTVRADFLDHEKTISQLDAKNQEMDSLKKFKIYLENEGEKVELMDTILPEKGDMDDVLVQMERIAVDNKLFVNSVTVLDADKEKNKEITDADRVKVSIQLDGEYPNLLNFVENMQNSTRLILVDKLGIVSNVDVEDQSVLYTVEMTILFQK